MIVTFYSPSGNTQVQTVPQFIAVQASLPAIEAAVVQAVADAAPIAADAIRAQVAADADRAEAAAANLDGAVRTVVQESSTLPSRPSGPGLVYWHTVDDPTAFMRPGDLWFRLTEVVTVGLFEDDFDRADQAISDTGAWTMVEGAAVPIAIVNGAVTLSSGSRLAVVAAPQMTANQYAEVVIVSHGAGAAQVQPSVRCSPSDSNGTWYGLIVFGGATAGWEMRRRISGTSVTIASGARTWTQLPVSARIEAQGDQIIALIDGVEVGRVTDTQITTGQPGLRLFKNSGDTGQVRADNYRAGDIW